MPVPVFFPFYKMLPVTVIGIGLTLVLLTKLAEGNYVELDTWGQDYCHHSYCGLLDESGWIRCCERRKKCCAYAELALGRTKDPFFFEMVKPNTPPPTTTTTARPLPTPAPRKSEDLTEDLGGSLEVISAPGSLIQGNGPANLRLPSRDQVKPVNIDDHWHSSGHLPKKPSKNDVTFHLPPLHPDIERIRDEEHDRESCRSKFCGVMSTNQWYNCCSKYKNCCAYVNYHTYRDTNKPQPNPFLF